jgi:hypothetical protein
MRRRVGDMVGFRDLTLKCNTARSSKNCGRRYDAAAKPRQMDLSRIARTLLQKPRRLPDKFEEQ